MGAGISTRQLPEIAPKLAAGAGISIAFELFRRFVIAKNRPACLKDGKADQYDNITVSLFHSIVSACLSFYFFFNSPNELSDLSGSGNFQELATLFSYSYAWYDLFDMLRTNGFNPLNMKEMMAHHSIMICGMLRVMHEKMYGNFMLYALNMEVNSIFLHGRALLQMCKQRETTTFKLVSVINILTNITHRLFVNYGIQRWALENDVVYAYTMNSVITFLNIKLLVTCVRRDFLTSSNAVKDKSE